MVTPRTGRPRGRPKGAKNFPKTLEAFVTFALKEPVVVPPRAIKPKKNITEATRKARSERSAKMRESIPTSGPRARGRRFGIPSERTKPQHLAVVAEQTALISKIMNKMAKEGILPDDPMAVEALKAMLVALRTEPTFKNKATAANILLAYTKAKPTAKVEHTIRTAEDILDEMSEDNEEA